VAQFATKAPPGMYFEPAAFFETVIGPSGGASSQGNVGPGASQGAMKDGTMNQGTTGTSTKPSPRGVASTSGADTAAGVKNTGTATEPGAVKDGVNKQ
jgi:hypothetical protein